MVNMKSVFILNIKKYLRESIEIKYKSRDLLFCVWDILQSTLYCKIQKKNLLNYTQDFKVFHFCIKYVSLVVFVDSLLLLGILQ